MVSLRSVRFSAWSRYAVAAGLAGVGVLLRLALDPIWGERLPYITLFPAVMLSAWLGGFWPGLVTTALSAIAASYLWVEPRDSLVVTGLGNWLGVLVFMLVGVLISALNELWRRGTNDLATSEQRLNVTLESIGDAVITADDAARITRFNVVAEALTGWPAAEALGQPVNHVLTVAGDEANRPTQVSVHQVIREGSIMNLAAGTRLVSRDGRMVPIEGRAAPIKVADGRRIGAVIVLHDISERRTAEEDRERQDRTARELAAIVESSDDAIVSKSIDSTIRSWNRAAEKMFGYTADEAIGQSIRLIIPRSRWPEEDEVLSRLRRGQSVDHFETVRRRKDGSELHVSLTISPIRSTAGVVIGASKIARDITERALVERERAELLLRERSARSELERASRIKDDFLAVVSHELRTPLNAVLGYSQLLASNVLSAQRAVHAIQAIQRNAYAQLRLVESLLDLSRIIAGKFELNLAALDLVTTLEAAAEALRPDAQTKAISLIVPTVPRRIALVGDGGRLQQVFWNLFSNAIKFTPPGGSVTVAVLALEHDVQVTVADTGQGITPEFLPFVFDRFKQQLTNRNAGLGLGLWLVREIVNAHGGTVVAESPGEGRGSTFTVTLPFTPTTTRSVPGIGDESQPLEVGQPLAGLDVLVVDDEGDARDLLSLMLATRGADVRAVSSAAEAFDAGTRESPDLLLADIAMPDEDGYSLIRRWRARELERRADRVPAIAITAYANPSDRQQAMAAGYDGHVAKPIDSEGLMSAISRVTGNAAGQP